MEEFLHQRDTVGVQDFILLEDFNEPNSFIANLKKRFREDLIYTSIGTVLISVNPYKNLDIYNDKIVQTYRSVNFYELPPHIFSIADSAYRAMCSERRDMCILISGESGSGKTEASKKVLQYVALTSTQSDDMAHIKDRLLQSTPILEAFGNAKTNWNDNSSRFGKYMDVQFNFKRAPIGGHIRNYLLEKSRVVHQANGERNFHIFYQLLESRNEKLLHKLSLEKTSQEYFYLGQGESIHIDAVDDHGNFNGTLEALQVCEFSAEDQQCLFAIIAFVLQLGEVDFIEKDSHAEVSDPDSVHTMSKIVGCSFSKLLAALQSRTIETRSEKVVTPFHIDQAFYARDALAKNIYDRVFSWIVQNINSSLDVKGSGKTSLMGLLDIYGFEIFATNSFEQFCINYCNEKLQQLFIELTLKSEQEEYMREGIEWEPVEYFNNKVICELVEDKTIGIIALLDEECLRPGNSTDVSFLSKLTQQAGRHAHFVSHECTDTATRKTITRTQQFRLRHFAGDVTYNVSGFIDKNNDLFFRDLKEAMIQSRNTVLSECFPSEELESRKRPVSAASQFKNSLAGLMEILMSKEPSYIRCIKPNDHKKPEMFDEKIVLHQIKYLGLMENVRVRRAGFAYRRPYEVFLKRYKSLCPETWPHHKGTVKQGVKVLVQHLDYDPLDYRLGTSKLFIKSPIVLFSTEDAFQRRKHELAILIQSMYRCYRQRQIYKDMKASAVRVQCMWRQVSAKQRMANRKRAVGHIRRFIKGFMMRKVAECEDNENFIEITRRNYLMRLRRNLPHNVCDKSWLTPPELVKETSKLLHDLCMKNLTLKYVKNVDPLKKHQLEEKVVAEEMFRFKKESYPYSVRDAFVVSRLASHHEQLLETVFKKKMLLPNEKLAYASAVVKYDRHGYKPRNRVLIATNQNIFILCSNTFTIKQKIAINLVKGMLLSKLSDGLFVIVTGTDVNENGTKGDLILQADYVIEAVTKIAIAGDHTKNMKVSSAYSIEHTLGNGKLGVIDFSEGQDYKVKKSHGKMSVCVPRVIYGPSGRSISTTL